MIEIKSCDIRFYEDKLETFLPGKIIDFHTHVWLAAHRSSNQAIKTRLASWPDRVANENSIEELTQTYKLLFPDKSVAPLMFSMAENGDDLDTLNNYVTTNAQQNGYPALLFSHPAWSAEQVRLRLVEGGFLGMKVYLSLAPAYIPGPEIRIFDFAPPHQLEVLNERSGILMLHVPRAGRLKDPVNLAQMIEIEEKYPNIKLVIAHVGRAYCNEDIGKAFEVLAKTKRMFFDISANSNSYVFEQLIKTVGPKRILFGSDLPILAMRARRITENGLYINIVPKGLYGDVSGDKNMREVTGDEAENLTFFIYEEIDAFRKAAQNTGLSLADIEDVFHNNAANILRSLP